MFGPVVVGEKVDLVPVEKADVSRFVQWFRDREVTKFMGYVFPVSPEDEEEWYEKVRKSTVDVVWAIALKTGERIGSVGLHGISWVSRRATSGIMIGDRSQWGKGIASEVMRLRTRFAFLELGLNSVDTMIAVENRASWRAAEKAGYQFTGVLRQYFYRGGRWYDVKVGSVLREDWEKLQA